MSHTSLLASHARFISHRLLPNEDVIVALRQMMKEQNLKSAFIAGCVGSLTDVALRCRTRRKSLSYRQI